MHGEVMAWADLTQPSLLGQRWSILEELKKGKGEKKTYILLFTVSFTVF